MATKREVPSDLNQQQFQSYSGLHEEFFFSDAEIQMWQLNENTYVGRASEGVCVKRRSF